MSDPEEKQGSQAPGSREASGAPAPKSSGDYEPPKLLKFEKLEKLIVSGE